MYGVTDGNPTPFFQRTYYKALIGHIEVDPTFKWLWKSCCQTKHMAFSWLQIKDRLSSRNMLRRNMTLDSCNCGLCSLAVEETREHLFLFCPFARQCWGILCLYIPTDTTSEKLFLCLRSSYNLKFLRWQRFL